MFVHGFFIIDGRTTLNIFDPQFHLRIYNKILGPNSFFLCLFYQSAHIPAYPIDNTLIIDSLNGVDKGSLHF